MTNEKAIEILKQWNEDLSAFEDEKDGIECHKLAISAIKKQIPSKIEIWNGQCACPTCNKLFGSLSQLKNLIHWEMPYCKFCGQTLDWSDI